MGWKKMILGEKMPDRNDPKYAERYEKEVATGRRFARLLRIDKAAACVQRFACRSPKLFLAVVFGIVIGCFSINVYRVVRICNLPKTENRTSVTSHQEQLLKERRGNRTNKTISHDTDRPQKQD